MILAGKGFGRTHRISEVGPSMEGQQVALGGWIEDLRKMGKVTFLTLRDATGMAQVVIKGERAAELEGLTRQSMVLAKGTVQQTKARGLEFELAAESVRVMSRAVHPLPVDPIGRLESGIDNRLNARALDMRNRKTAAIFRLRHHVLASLRGGLAGRGYIEITTPKIIGSASEGGADLFTLEYFGRKAYLAQSPQLYKEQMTIGLERVYEISNFYRAEKSHTGRHLSEFTSVDVEAAFMDDEDVMELLESLVKDALNDAAGRAVEQEQTGHKIAVPSVPFERLTYSKLVDELVSAGEKIQFGDDLQDAHLGVLARTHPGFYFITGWPTALKPFYIRPSDADASVSMSFDLQYGKLELSSGGTRLYERDTLDARLREQGLDPAGFEGHLRAFEWGMPPHSGWGMGLDRLMTLVAGVDNVRETVLYPRDPDRLSP